MTLDQLCLFAILAAALMLFAWGRLRYDVVAVLALLASVVAGLVPADTAFSGFGHPAVITVAAVLVLSRALRDSDLIAIGARLIQRLAARASGHVLAISGLGAVCSAFMNNAGALALILPVALKSAYENGRPASRLLMPLSFGTLLGGLTTLIGTPPNIIIANARAAETGVAFSMFDFTPVGACVALAGVAFVALVGWRLLPVRLERQERVEDLFHIEDYISEIHLPAQSPYVGQRIVELENLVQGDIAVVSLVRREDRILAPSGFLRLRAGDILMVESDTATLRRLVREARVELAGTVEMTAAALGSERVGVVEVVVPPGARLEGRTARSIGLHSRYGLNLLGVSRQGQPILERLGRVRFQAGDVLLVQGERNALPDAFAALGCLPLAARGIEFGRRADSLLRRWLSPLIFLLAILAMASGLLAPQVALVAGAAALVLCGEITLRDLYEAIDWPIIVLLGALIPVGMALETTGGTAIIAQPLLALRGEAPLWLVLALLMAVTMLLSDIMNNAATAVLMAPIGIAVAKGFGVAVEPFLMTVAIGASSTYLTPIGHQSNLLVMGPGGYRFGDYWRMGLPLDAVIVAVSVPMISWVWPV